MPARVPSAVLPRAFYAHRVKYNSATILLVFRLGQSNDLTSSPLFFGTIFLCSSSQSHQAQSQHAVHTIARRSDSFARTDHTRKSSSSGINNCNGLGLAQTYSSTS
jgi:hypothetical protein